MRRRTISELFEALAADERLTAEDEERLARHWRRLSQSSPKRLSESGTPEDEVAALERSLVEGLTYLRAEIGRNLDQFTKQELRRVVRELLVYLEWCTELLKFLPPPLQRQLQRMQQQRAAYKSAQVRGAKVFAELAAFDPSKPITKTAAERRLKEQHPAEWLSLVTREEREKRVVSFAQNLRKARRRRKTRTRTP